MENNKCFIYIVKHPITLEVRYVGQTCKGKSRFRKHLITVKPQPISCFIQSLISNSLLPIFEIIEYCEVSKLDEREKYWISYYRSICTNLLNLTDGGKTTRGYKMPKEVVEHLRNLSKTRKGYWKGKKLPENMRIAISEAAKLRIGKLNSFFGKKHSKKSKIKMQNSKKTKVSVICHQNNKIYKSMNDAGKDLNIYSETIMRQILKKQKTACGYTFSMIVEES